jgi:PAS domain S-box-containing protein
LLLAKQAAVAVEDFVAESEKSMVLLSKLKSINDVSGQEFVEDMKAVHENLGGRVNHIFRLDEKGIARAVYPQNRLAGAIGKDFSYRKYFQMARMSGAPYISKLLLAGGESYGDVMDRFESILVVVPAYYSEAGEAEEESVGRFAGVVGCSVDLSEITRRYIKPIRSGRSGYAWMVNGEGKFLAHPNEAFLGKSVIDLVEEGEASRAVKDAFTQLLRKEILQGRSGFGHYLSPWEDEEGKAARELVAYTPIHAGSEFWSIAVTASFRETISLTQRSFWNTLVLIGMTIVAISIGSFLILVITRMNVRMEEEMRHLEEEKALEAQVRRTKDYLENLLENANDIIYTLGRDGCFSYVNRKIEELGYTKEELQEKPYVEILDAKHQGRGFRKTLEQGTKQVYEMEMRDKEGELHHMVVSTSPLSDSEKGITGVLGIARDITEQRRMENELAEKNKFAAMGQMLTAIAHEVRNPLSSIKMNLQVLAKRMKPAGNDLKRFEIATREVRHLENLLREVLAYAKPPSMVVDSADLNEVILNSLALAESQFSERSIRAITSLDADAPCLEIDEGKIGQALLNLHLNAIEAMKEGGELRVKTFVENHGSRRASAGEGRPRFVKIEISDNGRGIPGDKLKNVFDPFFTTKSRGTGLGLTYVRKIVEMHDGVVEIDSAESIGTTVTISLPYREGSL